MNKNRDKHLCSNISHEIKRKEKNEFVTYLKIEGSYYLILK